MQPITPNDKAKRLLYTIGERDRDAVLRLLQLLQLMSEVDGNAELLRELDEPLLQNRTLHSYGPMTFRLALQAGVVADAEQPLVLGKDRIEMELVHLISVDVLEKTRDLG